MALAGTGSGRLSLDLDGDVAQRYRTGLVARRSAEDLAPVRRFEDIVRAIALEGAG